MTTRRNDDWMLFAAMDAADPVAAWIEMKAEAARADLAGWLGRNRGRKVTIRGGKTLADGQAVDLTRVRLEDVEVVVGAKRNHYSVMTSDAAGNVFVSRVFDTNDIVIIRS